MISSVSSGRVAAGPAARAARMAVSSTVALATLTISGLIRTVRAPLSVVSTVGVPESGDATLARGCARRLVVEPAKLPLPRVERGDALDQVGLVEIRPQGGGEVELGVRRLPDQEIRYPLLPGGANHEVGLWQVRVVERTGDVLIAELGRVGTGGDQVLHRVDDLGAATVVDEEVEDAVLVVASQRFGGFDLAEQRRRQPVPPPGDTQLHTLAVQFIDLAVEGLGEETHEPVN